MKKRSTGAALEFFTKRGGKRHDAEFHEPILAQGDHAAAKRVSDAVAKRLGLTASQIALLARKQDEE
jgi:hypothetical protein